MLKPATQTMGVETMKIAKPYTESPPAISKYIIAVTMLKRVSTRSPSAAITPISVMVTLRFMALSSRSGCSYTSAHDWLQK